MSKVTKILEEGGLIDVRSQPVKTDLEVLAEAIVALYKLVLRIKGSRTLEGSTDE